MKGWDWKRHLAGIVILSIIITFMVFEMMGEEKDFSLLRKYLVIAINTAVMWMGNSWIFNWLLKVYPTIDQTRKRIVTEILVMSLATTALTGLLYWLFCYIPFGSKPVMFYMNLKYSFLFTALAVIFHESVYFFQRWKESFIAAEKLQKERTVAQLESLRTQVNPHFLFNSLNTLITLIPLDSTKSVEFVRKLSEVYRYLLKAKSSEVTLVSEEMHVIQSYLFLLETRFQSSLVVKVNIQEKAMQKFIPPLSLQLLLENCVKHNVISKDKILTIEILDENDYLVVSNNLQKKQFVEDSTGIGLQNIRKRYELLSSKEIIIQEDEFFTVKIPLLEIQ